MQSNLYLLKHTGPSITNQQTIEFDHLRTLDIIPVFCRLKYLSVEHESQCNVIVFDWYEKEFNRKLCNYIIICTC